MNALPCRKCKTIVEAKIKKCPSCRVDHPGISTGAHIFAASCSLFGLFAFITCISGHNNKRGTTADYKAAHAANQNCRVDVQCWGDIHLGAAIALCQAQIEQRAKYGFKWENSFSSNLGALRWTKDPGGAVRYMGDGIKIQNAFGVFENHIYVCDFDPASITVVNVQLMPGKLAH